MKLNHQKLTLLGISMLLGLALCACKTSTSSHSKNTGQPVMSAPTPTTTSYEEPKFPTTIDHKIQAGDTYYALGRKYGVSPKAIALANPKVDPRSLSIGQKIKVPLRPAE